MFQASVLVSVAIIRDVNAEASAENLLDPDEIREMLSRAQAILEAKRSTLAEREDELRNALKVPQTEVADWEQKVAALEGVLRAFVSERNANVHAPVAAPAARGGQDGSAASLLDPAVAVVNSLGGATSSREVAKHLARDGLVDLDDARDLVRVRNALYYAAHTAKTILKVGRGTYAPLSYVVTELPVSALAFNGESDEQDLTRNAVQLPSGEGTAVNPHPGGST